MVRPVPANGPDDRSDRGRVPRQGQSRQAGRGFQYPDSRPVPDPRHTYAAGVQGRESSGPEGRSGRESGRQEDARRARLNRVERQEKANRGFAVAGSPFLLSEDFEEYGTRALVANALRAAA